MSYARWKSEWGELAIVAVISFFLYQMNMLVLFCIPLQVLFIRKGERQLLYACAAVLGAIGVAGFIRTAPVDESSLRGGLLAIEVLLPAFFLGGIFAVDVRWKVSVRTLYRVLVVTGVAGLCSVPLILALGRSENFSQLITAQIETVMQVFRGADGTGTSLLPDTDQLAELIIGLLLRNYLFAYYLTVVGSIWLGRSFAARMSRSASTGLRGFHLPDWLIWPFLVPWALVLLDLRIDIGVLKYVAWNVGLILMFTYGMQGIGILQTLLDRRNVPRGLRIMLTGGLALMVLWPGANLIVLIGLPGLGVSELWIHFRKEQKEKENDENS